MRETLLHIKLILAILKVVDAGYACRARAAVLRRVGGVGCGCYVAGASDTAAAADGADVGRVDYVCRVIERVETV